MKTREEYLEAIYKMAESLAKKGGFDSDKQWALMKLCGEWNTAHWADRIYLLIWAKDSEGHTGLVVEDNFFPVADWNN